MLPIDDLKLRRSEITSRLNIIAGMLGDEVTPDVRDEADTLGTELDGVEVRYRAALRSQPETEVRTTVTEDSEFRESAGHQKQDGFPGLPHRRVFRCSCHGCRGRVQFVLRVAAGDHVPRELFEGRRASCDRRPSTVLLLLGLPSTRHRSRRSRFCSRPASSPACGSTFPRWKAAPCKSRPSRRRHPPASWRRTARRCPPLALTRS